MALFSISLIKIYHFTKNSKGPHLAPFLKVHIKQVFFNMDFKKNVQMWTITSFIVKYGEFCKNKIKGKIRKIL